MPKVRLKKTAQVEPEIHSKPFDFTYDITWRIFRVMSEFTEGIEFISRLERPVTFFGSARTKPQNRYYKDAVLLAKRLGRKGFTIVTGGGPGIMEAGNKGAFEAKASSVGLNIELKREQRTNKYVTKSIGFDYFFSRKAMLTTSAQAYVFFPGGFGTLDELFSVLTLIETKKIEPRPIVLFGSEYWRKLNYFIKENMLKHHKMISEQDLHLYSIVDTVKDAEHIIFNSKRRLYTFM
ncbi:MAG: TIGR00730 family Rossman fold protein [Candidatus Kerfeldbacteria bacterium]|nr:TIGR00730 family Rossman fold protein [Candidatus Kerfeldbacteria bacterium]